MAWGLWLVIGALSVTEAALVMATLVRVNASGGLATREFRLKRAELLPRV